jgi:integrase
MASVTKLPSGQWRVQVRRHGHVRLARIALNKLGLVPRSNERDRRPTLEELDRIIGTADANLRQIIPLGRLVKFAIATAMRQDKICRVTFDDFNAAQSTLMIRQRKHPRQKQSIDQVIPLVPDAGYDPVKLIQEQHERFGRSTGFIFAETRPNAGGAEASGFLRYGGIVASIADVKWNRSSAHVSSSLDDRFV